MVQLPTPGATWQLLSRMRPVSTDAAWAYLQLLRATLSSCVGPLPCPELVAAAAYEAENLGHVVGEQGVARVLLSLGSLKLLVPRLLELVVCTSSCLWVS